MDFKLPFNVQERDIDLLLLERSTYSQAFVAWLSEQAGVQEATLESYAHSVFASKGETDVLLYVCGTQGRVALMIENKIGAAMQPQQCERYHERGQQLCGEGKADKYITLLCAPESYLSQVQASETWGARVSLEQISIWLNDNLGSHSRWQIEILNSACAKARRAATPSDDDLSNFKKKYRAFVLQHYPMLTATDQTGRDQESYLNSPNLPEKVRLKHSFFKGQVSLVFERPWRETLDKWDRSKLDPDAWIELFTAEVHVRRATEVFDPALDFDQQHDVARQGLDSLVQLLMLATEIVKS